MENNRFTTAAILAGGQSRRMGFDKFKLTIGSQRLLDAVTRQLAGVFSNIIVVANSNELIPGPGVTLIRDTYPGLGPLAGIHAALRQADCDYVYVLACDMPEINLDYICFLKDKLQGRNFDAAMGKIAGKSEPFQAFYARRILPLVEQNLFDRKLCLQDLIGQLDCLFADEKEIRRFSPELSVYDNINTAKELESYRQILASRQPR